MIQGLLPGSVKRNEIAMIGGRAHLSRVSDYWLYHCSSFRSECLDTKKGYHPISVNLLNQILR